MTNIHKSIWRLANAKKHFINFELIDGNEWKKHTQKDFYKWLVKKEIPKLTDVYIIRDINDIEETRWEEIISNWKKFFSESFSFDIWAKDYSWVFEYNEIGVVKFGRLQNK